MSIKVPTYDLNLYVATMKIALMCDEKEKNGRYSEAWK
jgi:hypothetical protein